MSDADKPRATGGCHCGAVRFEVRGPLRDAIICHCSDCRRIHGHVAAHSAAKWGDLHFVREDGLKWYDSSVKARRGFCDHCGAGLFFDLHGRDIVSICAGALDEPTGIETAMHLFVDSAADYERTDAKAPRHEGIPAALADIQFR